MNIVYLILGSNLGNRQQFIVDAKRQIAHEGCAIMRCSALYQTEPWGFDHDNQFLNQVVEVRTSLDPLALLAVCQKIEMALGRVRGNARYAGRTIDIDILFYDEAILNTSALTIPHPEIANRRFVLVPLAEITPALLHPVLHKTILELLKECEDRGGVEMFSEDVSVD